VSRLFRSIFSLAILGVCSPAGAIDPIPREPGWSGFVILGGGAAEAETNMVAGIDVYGINVGKPRIDSLTESPDSMSFGLPQVNLSLNYTFETRTQLFFGNSLENVLQFDTAANFGVRQQFADSSILEVAAVSTPILSPTQVWADPYVVGVKRVETDRTSRGLRVEYDRILGSGFGVRYTQRTTDVDKERSGTGLGLTEDEMSLLDRNGDSRRLQLSYRFPKVGRNLFDVRIGRLEDDLDGEAMSGDQDEFFLTHAYVGDRFALVSNLFLAQQDFDAVNPVFDRTRKDDNWGVGFVLLDMKLFHSAKWWGQATFAWFEQDSNIDFYDAKSTLLMLGAQYRF
jgi:hypothetical protein